MVLPKKQPPSLPARSGLIPLSVLERDLVYPPEITKFVKKSAMQTEAQKLELITWIASINDKGMLEKLYSVKKAMEPKKIAAKKTPYAEALACSTRLPMLIQRPQSLI